ncbi:MAG TPA: glycosyltransferase family 39 protein [Verrucomicrobiae bacterium]|nr:glycosyltransferase family 39 protein [Verrucomicrobiae bacterium]
MRFLLTTKREKAIAVSLLILWALLYLPNLRSNPNWYGDEGEWMEKSWTFIHGTPRIGPITNDFVFPYPYPPLYMLVNGALLRVFGDDIVVGRALGAVTALAAAVVLFWIGRRLRDEWFGAMCATALLVYPQADMNFRWVRSHPMAGALAMASAGFLISYLQDKRFKDLVWAGALCSLATATNYYAVGMIPAVMAVALWVNGRRWREPAAWRDVIVGTLTAGGYGALFVLWYVSTKGGAGHLLEQVHRLGGMTQPPSLAEVGARIVKFCFTTPTHIGPRGLEGRDWWLIAAVAGLVAFPVARLRVWLVVWASLLMFPIFRKQDNVSVFFYPATIFLPLMALGVGGATEQLGRFWQWVMKKPGALAPRLAPAGVAFVLWGATSLKDSFGHFDSMIDMFTQSAPPASADAALEFVNTNTTSNDFVLVPKQIYWLVKNAKKSMLSHCVTYEGRTNDAWPVSIPHGLFWFDCRWPNAKYLVLASGVTSSGQPRGIDLIYTRGLAGVPDVIEGMVQKKWPVVFTGGHQVALVNIGGVKQWPVAVDGEYLVLANPQFTKAASD